MSKQPIKRKVVSAFPLLAEGVLRGYLAPRLAKDAAVDLKPAILALGRPVKRADGTYGFAEADKFKLALDAALKAGTDGKAKLAMDADVADVQEVLSQLEDMAPQIADLVVGGPTAAEDPAAPPGADPADPALAADPGSKVPPPGADPTGTPDDDTGGENNLADDPDPMAKILQFLQDKLSPEDMDALKSIMEGQMAEDKQAVPKAAMDAAIAASEKRLRDGFKAARQAEQAVTPYVGPIKVAMDSAEEVYRFALKQLKVNVEGVHPSAFPAILAAQPVPGARPKTPTPPAMDAAVEDGLTKRFGATVNRLKSA